MLRRRELNDRVESAREEVICSECLLEAAQEANQNLRDMIQAYWNRHGMEPVTFDEEE